MIWWAANDAIELYYDTQHLTYPAVQVQARKEVAWSDGRDKHKFFNSWSGSCIRQAFGTLQNRHKSTIGNIQSYTGIDFVSLGWSCAVVYVQHQLT